MTRTELFLKTNKLVIANCKRRIDEKPVKNNMAVTPEQMEMMVNQGQPVAAQMLDNMYYDGEVNPKFGLPIDRQRGVDIAEAWEAHQKFRQKVKNAVKNEHFVKQNQE